MTLPQRWLVVSVLSIATFVLPAWFLEYRVGTEGFGATVLVLREGAVKPQSMKAIEWLLDSHGTERIALYARQPYSGTTAAIGGLALPISFATTALYLALGARSTR